MLSPKNSHSLILIFWPVTAPEQPRSNSMRKYSGIFPVAAAVFLIGRGAPGLVSLPLARRQIIRQAVTETIPCGSPGRG